LTIDIVGVNMSSEEPTMKRETAEVFVASLENMFERLGINFERALADTFQVRWSLPSEMGKYFKYGNDRESVIRYLTKHVPEPTAKELAKLPVLSLQVPRILRQAMVEAAKQFPRSGRYRHKIAPEEREKVCRQIQRLMKSKRFPRAVEEVARRYGVHVRTIRRIWKAWGGAM